MVILPQKQRQTGKLPQFESWDSVARRIISRLKEDVIVRTDVREPPLHREREHGESFIEHGARCLHTEPESPHGVGVL